MQGHRLLDRSKDGSKLATTTSFHTNSFLSRVIIFPFGSDSPSTDNSATCTTSTEPSTTHTQRKHKALYRSHCKSQTRTTKMCLALPTMGSLWHPPYQHHAPRPQSVPCIFNEEPRTLICKDQTFYR